MTAIDASTAIGADAPEMPRFDDSMVSINEFLRTRTDN